MKKLIVFTDIHFVEDGGEIIGLDPVARFQDGLAHALTKHPDAERVLITGDLAHRGKAEEYARLRAAIDACPLPVHLMIGNHDNRETFCKAFPEVPLDDAGFVQSIVDQEDLRLILLDTVDEDAEIKHSGVLCAERLSWLRRALDSAGARKVIVFMHHPPILTGFSGMDYIGLRNRDEVADLLLDYPQVVQVIAGHVHRTIQGAAGGVPVAVFKSPCHQMPMALGDAAHDQSVPEPGAYGLILLHSDGLIIHTEDFTLPAETPKTDGHKVDHAA